MSISIEVDIIALSNDYSRGLGLTLTPVPLKSVVEHAIYLATEKGEFVKLQGLPGKVQEYEDKDYSLLYTTPFSGAEVYPGVKRYIVDIWYKHKKIFNFDFASIEDIPEGKTKRSKWVYEFMDLGK